jgi:arylsulfatase A-like enzyme
VGKWHLEANTLSGEGLYENYPQVQEGIRRCGFDFAEAIYRENLGGSMNVNVDGNPVTHNMEHVTAEAIRFIQQAVDGVNQSGSNNENSNNHTSKPFFLYFNPTVPHSSGDVTDALLEANCKDTVQGRLSEAPFVPYGMTANIDAEGKRGCREYRKTVLERASAAAAAIGNSGEPVDDDKLAGAVWVDDAIGSLFETLEALNILNNTFVLFQSDHGMDAKGSLFEGGSRIVQFVHYPDRIKAGVSEEAIQQQQGWKFEGLVSTIDVAPTLMSLAGVPLTPPTDDGDGSIDEKHRYDMDGKSWFSDAVAANIGEVKQSNSFQQQEQQQIYSRKINMNYFEERCIFVEEGLDRSVRCGCYKYIYISDLTKGFTVRAASE